MNLATESYRAQSLRWPTCGRHILAQFDADSIVVYQAYRPDIGTFAAQHGYFGGSFSLGRMSWIKPNFLWMMFRSGWGTKENQEITLAIRLQRAAFESILKQAVHTSFVPERYSSHGAWQLALKASPVRMQWDPDHDPVGNALSRRAIQLGLSGPTLEKYARDWILEIQDVSDFVKAQRHNAVGAYTQLATPREDVFVPSDRGVCEHLGLDAPGVADRVEEEPSS